MFTHGSYSVLPRNRESSSFFSFVHVPCSSINYHINSQFIFAKSSDYTVLYRNVSDAIALLFIVARVFT